MPPRNPIIPTLLMRPVDACPRCTSARVRVLVVHSEGGFSWRECDSCGYLWALPSDLRTGWLPTAVGAAR